MEFKRDFYNPNIGGLSMKNEPSHSCLSYVDARKYPDMHLAYRTIAKLFNVDVDSVILGNGVENVMKNVLMALHPKSISWSYPSWGFIDVYCQQLQCKAYKHLLKHNEELFYESEFSEPIDVYYSTTEFNNFVCYSPCKNNIDNAKYSILDMSYDDLATMKQHVADRTFENSISAENTILIGSFDKMYGAGLRCAFAIFSKSLSKQIHMYRENFINSLAAQFIIAKAFNKPQFTKCYDYLSKLNFKPGVMLCYNFISVPSTKPYDKLQNRFFEVGKLSYCRFGMPSNQEELGQLLQAFSDLNCLENFYGQD